MKKIVNYTLYSIVWLSLIALMCCCTDERETFSSGGVGNEPRDVTFTVRVPAGSMPDTYALTASDENEVTQIAILLFDGSGYTYQPIYSSAITTDPSDNSIKTFTLKIPQGTYDLVMLANSNAAIGAILPGLSAGDSKASVLAQLKISSAGKWNAAAGSPGYMAIPMWGEVANQTINNSLVGSIPASLVRMLAKVDVSLSTTTATSKFALKSVRLYNYYDAGQIAPNTTTWNVNPSVPTSAVKPTTPATSPLAYTTMTTTDISCMNEIYTFEAEAGAANTLLSNTCLVVGGVYIGDTKETFYRIDFSNTSPLGVTTYLALLRNHNYTVNITDVSGPGLPDAPSAFKSRPVNIKATILDWNDGDMSDVVSDGQYKLGVSQGEFSLSREARTATSLDNSLSITTDYPSGWKVSKVVDGSNSDISWLSLTPDNSSTTGTVATKLILTENTTGNSRVGYIHLSAGRLTYVVKVTQSIDAALMLSIRDASNTTDITELTFAAGVGVAPVAQQILLSWLPADKTLSASSSTLGSNPAFAYALSSNKPGAGENSYIDPSGSKTLSIQPTAMTAADLTSDPFLERISKVDFSVFNGSKTLSKSVYFRQIVPLLLVEPTYYYALDGSTYTLRVRSNTDWRIKSVTPNVTFGTGSLLNLVATDNLKVGTTGTGNTNPGTAVTFRVANNSILYGTLTVVFESPTGLFGDVTLTMNLASEYYPAMHKGWAGSNIYWDDVAGRLTFDGIGITTNQQNQGLFFQWGSLWGMSPYSDAANKIDWTGSTILYSPTPASGTATSFGYATYANIPRVKDATTIISNPPTGKSHRDRAYLYEITDAAGTNSIGDICRYMTLKGWAPAGSWRMPTSQEFDTPSIYGAWQGTASTTNPTVTDAGTTQLSMGRTKTDTGITGTPFFPAAGAREYTNGQLDRVGINGFYYSGSPEYTHGYYLNFNNSNVNPRDYVFRSYGFPIRCVKE